VWPYLERVELYFMANGIPAEKKVPVLLTTIGTRNYSIVQSLVAPALPRDKTFEELTTALKSHFQPKPLIISERFKFYRRDQGLRSQCRSTVPLFDTLLLPACLGTFWIRPCEIGLFVGLGRSISRRVC